MTHRETPWEPPLMPPDHPRTVLATHYVWSSEGSPSEPPSRLATTSCPRCKVLVPQAELAEHRQWHQDLGEPADGEQ